MLWVEAQDTEGYPARRLRIGQFDAYLSGEKQKDDKFLWHSLTIHPIGEFDTDKYTMDRYSERVYERWIEAHNATDAERQGNELVKEFVKEHAAKLRKEADELEQALENELKRARDEERMHNERRAYNIEQQYMMGDGDGGW
jgi:hypothetical protein